MNLHPKKKPISGFANILKTKNLESDVLEMAKGWKVLLEIQAFTQPELSVLLAILSLFRSTVKDTDL